MQFRYIRRLIRLSRPADANHLIVLIKKKLASVKNRVAAYRLAMHATDDRIQTIS